MKRTLISALALTVAGTASAVDTLLVNGLVSGQFRVISATFTGQTNPDNWTTTNAGPFSMTMNGSLNFIGFCVDPLHNPQVGSPYNITITALPNGGLANSARLAWLYNTYAPGIGSGTAAEMLDKGSGLQMAIWDVLLDGGNGLATGLFRASSGSSGALTKAQEYITASVGQSSTGFWYRGPLGPSQPQEMIAATPVPEPSTLAGVGILALAWLKRRRR